MRSKRRSRYLRTVAPEPVKIPEDRTEHEEARRQMRDWLRERDENDVIEFEESEA